MEPDKQIIDAISYHVSLGATNEDACVMEEIDYNQFVMWFERGRRTPDLDIYRKLYLRVKKADAESKQVRINSIRAAGRGSPVFVRDEDGHIKYNDKGQPVVSHYEGGEWRADAWFLENRHREEFHRKKTVSEDKASNTPALPDTETLQLNSEERATLKALLDSAQERKAIGQK